MDPIDFWIWLANHRQDLEDFLRSDFSDYTPYEALHDQLKAYSDWLVPELTFDKVGKHVLVISCDGRPEGIPDAKALYDAFPVIPGWEAQLYRQAGDFWGTNINGIHFGESDLLVFPRMDFDSGQYDIMLYVKEWEEDENEVEVAAMIYLDHCLGEYAVMTRLRYIAFAPLEEAPEEVITLTELRTLMDFPPEAQ